MSSGPINQREYLKKYLFSDKDAKKKKKKKVSNGSIAKRMKVMDDDIDVAHHNFFDGSAAEADDNTFLDPEDAPQIAEVIDDRPEYLKRQQDEEYGRKWKSIAGDSGKDSSVDIIERLKQSMDNIKSQEAAEANGTNHLSKSKRKILDSMSSFKKKPPDEPIGTDAATVFRDRHTGKRRNLEEEQVQKQRRKDEESKHKEKYDRWGKGLKQVEDQQSRVDDALHEMAKPLARYADDADLEGMLKDQDREGDPMLEYVRAKRAERGQKDGHGITPKKPVYQGPFPPNRFNIRPGYRWDGVDRSCGFERKWFEAQSDRKARDLEAYQWSTEDM